MDNSHFIFTQKRLESLAPKDKRYMVHDNKVPSLVLMVRPTGTKTFQVYRRFGQQFKRITLGGLSALSVPEARKLAQQTITKMLNGVDPNAEKRAARHRGLTLGDASHAYLVSRKLAPSTVSAYKTVHDKYLGDWDKRPLNEITRDDIARRHASITKTSATQANRTMRFLRAVYNWAREEYLDENNRPLIPDNPVGAISHRRQWNKETRRTDCIRLTELATWWETTETEDATIRDYLRVVVLTGLRRREAAPLRWAGVDLVNRTLTVRATKNGDDHTLPLSDYLHTLLTAVYMSFPASASRDTWKNRKKRLPVLPKKRVSTALFTVCGARLLPSLKAWTYPPTHSSGF